MFDAIKYSSLQLREINSPCIPFGPSFKRAQPSKIRLPLCTLELRLPKHNRIRGDSTGQRKIGSDIYDLEGRSFNRNIMPSQSWEYSSIANRKWAFNGPWFSGLMGQLTFSAVAVKTTISNPKLNFLHPRAFESGVFGYLTASEGHALYDEGRKIPEYKAPLNWSPIPNLPVPAVQFDMEMATPICRYHLAFIPVSRDRLVCLRFDYWQECSGSQDEKDQKISPKPMQDLIDNIIRSVTLTPSPELEAELGEIRKICPNLSVSPECSPLKWPADVDKDGITILEYDKRRYALPTH
ncbi:hypothetical protein ACONUD_10910 [Microbulbifer harenosus]|uniref:DUF2169 domain-containing protein n=1 Tax=Microbulbifer harenosus TaxID=2576840 RepID=A0ABY2UK20_9GAMM|nr:hypothetical protein [Microbulbifer harenosus]TLM76597.1 hypothetical protein FDY93_12785 [Microbulbifer harenosus]